MTGQELLLMFREYPEKLRGVDFSGVRLMGMSFKGADFTGTDFTGATLVGCNFRETNLTCANFTDAVLYGSSFNGANLAETDFTGADLRWAELHFVDCWWTVFTGASLIDSEWLNAKISDISDSSWWVIDAEIQQQMKRNKQRGIANERGCTARLCKSDDASDYALYA